MRQEHAGHGERIESELRDRHDFPGAADAAASMLEAELAGQDHHVMFRAQLMLGERFQGLGGLGRQAKAVAPEFALAVVVKLTVAGLPDALERLEQSGLVSRGHSLPPGDCEQSFGASGNRELGQLLIDVPEIREEAVEELYLLVDGLGRPVAGEVAVIRLHLLVGVLITQRELPDAVDDVDLELVAVLDETLETVLVEDALGNGAIDRVFAEPLDLLGLTLSDRHGRHLKTPSWCHRLYSAG